MEIITTLQPVRTEREVYKEMLKELSGKSTRDCWRLFEWSLGRRNATQYYLKQKLSVFIQLMVNLIVTICYSPLKFQFNFQMTELELI